MAKCLKADKTHIDLTTSNKSFIEISELLKSKGVKNHDFMLKLYDKELVGVDPYDPNLDAVTEARIKLEASRNVWYFLREIVRIPAQAGGYCRFDANLHNIAQVYCFEKGISTYSVTSRQTHRDMNTVALLLWDYAFNSKRTKHKIIGRTMNDSKMILFRIETILKGLPRYLTYGVDTSCEPFIHDLLKNIMKVGASVLSLQHVINSAREMKEPIIHINDFEYIKYNNVLIEESIGERNMLETTETTWKRRCYVITSAARENNTETGMTAKQIRDNCVKWDTNLFDLAPDELIKYISYSKYRMVYIEYLYSDLGFDEEWFNRMCTILNNRQEVIDREVLLKR